MMLALCETRLEILPEWTDPNGHMNVAYYVLAFDRATTRSTIDWDSAGAISSASGDRCSRWR